MCYALLLSTTSDEDLTAHNSRLVRFTSDLPDIMERARLSHGNKWYAASRQGCSCAFRHLYSVELGFGAPVDWYDENEEDILATKEFIKIVRELIDAGHRVDCVDAWWSGSELPDVEMPVDLNIVSDDQFRFFENHKFIFSNTI